MRGALGEHDWIDDLEQEVATQSGQAATWSGPAELAVALDPKYRMRAHLKYLSERLAQAVEDVEGGRSRYLLVSMPPRLGKSHMCAINFPEYVLHKHPDWPIMLLSHAPDLAATWGRQIRRDVEDHGDLLGVEVARDAGAVTDWQVVKDGETVGQILSKSIRQSVTGRGAKVMIMDDVVKDFADAHSESNREFVWNWWTANSRSRLEPPSLVVLIGTRWHEDDIIGRMRSPEYDGDPDLWEVISFPAIAEDPKEEDPRTGEPVGPDALGRAMGEPLLSPIVNETAGEALERWADIRRSVGTYAWSAIYQQRPSPAAGSIFITDWWRYWRPADLDGVQFDRAITSWDMAFKGTDSSDYVVGQLWACAGADRYLLRQVRERMTFTETLKAVEAFIDDPRTLALVPGGVHEHVVEDKANGTAVIDVLRKTIPGMVPFNPGQDSKEGRARSVAPTVEAGNVYLPALEDWLPDFVSEHRAFPNGANDDQVDGTSQALIRLRRAGETTVHSPTQGRITRGYQHPGGGGRLRALPGGGGGRAAAGGRSRA